jgi:hypothetical protein
MNFFGKLWIGDKVIWGWLYNFEGAGKKKCHKMNVHPFSNKLG